MTCVVRHSAAPLLSQRSISFRTEARPLPAPPLRSRTKASSFPRRRNSQCWSDTVESHDLTAKEIKRQEVAHTYLCPRGCILMLGWGGGGVLQVPPLEASIRGDYERGCELALEAQLPVLNNQLRELTLADLSYVSSACVRSWHHVHLLNGFDSCR